MPTDIVLVLLRKAKQEEEVKEASKRCAADLTIVYLWSAVGLVLTGLIYNLGIDPALFGVLIGAE